MLERHIAQQAAVLDGLSCGVEVYGPDKRLRFHNPAFVEMARSDEDWLADSPRMGEVLDAMRSARTLPETGDYPGFKRGRLALFQTVVAPQTDVIHLPDGAAWRLSAIPHADGGLVLIYEDASATLGLERDVNILLDVRRATIDQLLAGVAVFGEDGRLKLYNPAFQRLWDLTPMTLAHEPHVLDVAGDAQAFFSGDADWSAFRDWMTDAVFERQPDSGNWDRVDGSRVEFVVSPLPDGNVMLAFLDVTDALNRRRELQFAADALVEADRLRSRFEANLAREIRPGHVRRAREMIRPTRRATDQLACEAEARIRNGRRRCRSANLIGNDAEAVAFGPKTQHGFDKVVAMRAKDPRRSEDPVARAAVTQTVFAKQLGCAVNAKRRCCVVGSPRIGAAAGKHIVGR